MTQAEFEDRKRDAHARLDAEWDQARREKRHGDLFIGANFSNGAPGDLIVTAEKRYRVNRE